MSFAITSVAIAAVGAGVAAYSSIKQGQATSAADQYESEVAQQNQQIADQNAQYALQEGQQQAAAKQQQTAQTIATQRADVAASGVDPNTGSAQRIQGDTAALGALDTATIQNNAARTAWGYQTQGLNFGEQASLLSSQSASAESAGELGAFSSIIGGAGSVSNKWYTYTKLNGGSNPFGS